MIKTKTKHRKEQSQESLSLSTLYQLTFPGLVSSSVKGESPKLGQLLQIHDWHNHQVVEVTGGPGGRCCC